MKIPNWLWFCLMAVPVLTAGVLCTWYWVTLPHRTANTFVAALVEGRDEDAKRLWAGTQQQFESAVQLRQLWRRNPHPDSRSFFDIVCGRQGFNGSVYSFTDFYVERGSVVRCCRRSTIQHPFPPGPDIPLRVEEKETTTGTSR